MTGSYEHGHNVKIV